MEKYIEKQGRSQPRLTGSKLETPITAPTMAVSTTPPAAMLSKKFFREGETPLAASATSGTTMEAVNAAAVNPATAFSFNEAFTSNFAAGFETTLDGLSGMPLTKAAVAGSLLAARVSGSAIDTAEVEAICVVSCDGAGLLNVLVLYEGGWGCESVLKGGERE